MTACVPGVALASAFTTIVPAVASAASCVFSSVMPVTPAGSWASTSTGWAKSRSRLSETGISPLVPATIDAVGAAAANSIGASSTRTMIVSEAIKLSSSCAFAALARSVARLSMNFCSSVAARTVSAAAFADSIALFFASVAAAIVAACPESPAVAASSVAFFSASTRRASAAFDCSVSFASSAANSCLRASARAAASGLRG